MQTKIAQAFSDTSEATYPIQFVQISNMHHVPVPLVRVSTCGGLQLEVLQEVISTNPALGRYQVATLQQRPKGSSTGLTLLKVLVSLPEHHASKDWLTEHVPSTRCSGEEEEEGWGRRLIRIDNVVYLLRSLLCPTGIVEKETVRKMLVVYIKNHRESGSGYRLASDPLLWLDVDIIAASVKQALLLEQQGKDALSFWEQAHALASRGIYLPDDCYSDWAKDKRMSVEGHLRQSVQALRRLYLARTSEAGEEQAILLLRSYWHTHQTDEDILRPLLELLSKHDGVQEARECYQLLCEQLEQEESTPDPRTQKTAQNVLHIGQSAYESMVTVLKAKSIHSSSSQNEILSLAAPQREVLSMLSAAIVQGIKVATQTLERIDMDTTRRDLLHMIGNSLILAGIGNEFHPFVHGILNGNQTALLEAEVATRWHVYHSGNTTQAHNGFHLWLAEIERCAKGALSRSQNTHAYSLVSTSYQLQGSIFRDKMDYHQAHNSYRKAFLAADEFDNLELKSSSLARRGVTFIQQQKPIDAIQYLEGALLTIEDLDLPFLKGYIFQALSEAHAMAQHKDQSQRNIDLAEQALAQRNSVLELSNCQPNTTSTTAQRGVNSVLLQDHACALDLLNRALNTYAPSLLRGRARLIAQKAEAYYGLGCIDESTSTAQDAFDIANAIGSQKTIARVKSLYTILKQSSYGKESSIIQLGRMLATN